VNVGVVIEKQPFRLCPFTFHKTFSQVARIYTQNPIDIVIAFWCETVVDSIPIASVVSMCGVVVFAFPLIHSLLEPVGGVTGVAVPQ
jgi:hypothetical protein